MQTKPSGSRSQTIMVWLSRQLKEQNRTLQMHFLNFFINGIQQRCRFRLDEQVFRRKFLCTASIFSEKKFFVKKFTLFELLLFLNSRLEKLLTKFYWNSSYIWRAVKISFKSDNSLSNTVYHVVEHQGKTAGKCLKRYFWTNFWISFRKNFKRKSKKKILVIILWKFS